MSYNYLFSVDDGGNAVGVVVSSVFSGSGIPVKAELIGERTGESNFLCRSC